MTVSEVRGIGRQRGEREVVGHRESIMSVTKLKLEIAVNDPFVDAAVDAIVLAARSGDSGRYGDGKVFVLPIEECVHVRTGASGPDAVGP